MKKILEEHKKNLSFSIPDEMLNHNYKKGWEEFESSYSKTKAIFNEISSFKKLKRAYLITPVKEEKIVLILDHVDLQGQKIFISKILNYNGEEIFLSDYEFEKAKVVVYTKTDIGEVRFLSRIMEDINGQGSHILIPFPKKIEVSQKRDNYRKTPYVHSEIISDIAFCDDDGSIVSINTKLLNISTTGAAFSFKITPNSNVRRFLSHYKKTHHMPLSTYIEVENYPASSLSILRSLDINRRRGELIVRVEFVFSERKQQNRIEKIVRYF